MTLKSFTTQLIVVLILLARIAFGFESPETTSSSCALVNSRMAQAAAQGGADEASRILSSAIGPGQSGLQPHCAGVLSNNVAALFLMSGRLNEARLFADRAVAYFQKCLPVDDANYLGPLHVLATVDLELGSTRAADEVLRKMLEIRAISTEDRTLVDFMSGAVLQREGRLQEAESHYLAAVGELTGAGRETSAEGLAIWGQLASLYLQDRRYADARATADEGLRRLNLLHDLPPLYRMKLLNVRAVVWARMERWQEAETDLAQAVSLGRSQAHLDNTELRPIVSNYALVLRKLHRKNARSVGKWAASLQGGNIASSLIIDISELPLHRH